MFFLSVLGESFIPFLQQNPQNSTMSVRRQSRRLQGRSPIMDKRLAHGRISVTASAEVAIEAVDPAPVPAAVPAAVPALAPPPTAAAAPRSPREALRALKKKGRGRPRDLTHNPYPAYQGSTPLTDSERSARYQIKNAGHLFYK
jgi:hypothetical protein